MLAFVSTVKGGGGGVVGPDSQFNSTKASACGRLRHESKCLNCFFGLGIFRTGGEGAARRGKQVCSRLVSGASISTNPFQYLFALSLPAVDRLINSSFESSHACSSLRYQSPFTLEGCAYRACWQVTDTRVSLFLLFFVGWGEIKESAILINSDLYCIMYNVSYNTVAYSARSFSSKATKDQKKQARGEKRSGVVGCYFPIPCTPKMWHTPQNMAHSKETENWKRAAKD
jgi:hypothetical protein